MNNLLIMIPTYNEIDNVLILFNKIMAVMPDADVLFVDDNSPDGTGDLIDSLKYIKSNVFVIHRNRKMGIGSAHKAGISWAYTQGYKTLITMDSDFTHKPEYIPKLIENTSDVVIGSRFIVEKGLEGWTLGNRIRTNLTHFMIKLLLGIEYDATTAFRLYRLDRIPLSTILGASSNGYPFFLESLYALHNSGFNIKEIPMILPARMQGSSKMKATDIVDGMATLFRLFLKGKPRQAQWDTYWASGSSIVIYSIFATIYRKMVFKPALNHYVNKYTTAGMVGLHAGCGSGQVDEDIRKTRKIIALDNSSEAISLYKRNYGDCNAILGDIMGINLPDKSVDFIYNLGVMEHFTEKQIFVILKEFSRVLKDNGKVILFWVAEFGLPATIFKVFSGVFQSLIPQEITRVTSKQHAIDLCSGFSIIEYYFGTRDLFTHSIIILKKGI